MTFGRKENLMSNNRDRQQSRMIQYRTGRGVVVSTRDSFVSGVGSIPIIGYLGFFSVAAPRKAMTNQRRADGNVSSGHTSTGTSHSKPSLAKSQKMTVPWKNCIVRSISINQFMFTFWLTTQKILVFKTIKYWFYYQPKGRRNLERQNVRVSATPFLPWRGLEFNIAQVTLLYQ